MSDITRKIADRLVLWIVSHASGPPDGIALETALHVLLDATTPYVERAAPHEQLFSGEDLHNLDRLLTARRIAQDAIGEP